LDLTGREQREAGEHCTVIKSRNRWAGNEARMGEIEDACRMLENLKAELGVDGRIILRWIVRK